MTAFPFFNFWTWAFVFLEKLIQSLSSVYTFPCFYLCTLRRNWLHVPMLIDKKRISFTPEARSPSMKKADRGVQIFYLFCAPKTKIYMTEKDGYTLKKKKRICSFVGEIFLLSTFLWLMIFEGKSYIAK